MYRFIKGIINRKLTTFSYLVNVEHWGIEVFLPYTMDLYTPVELLLYNHFSTETGFTFFGFNTIEELDFFQLLITVPGLGAKTAIKLVHQLGFYTIGSAINKQAFKVFTSVPGIGSKIATRIVNDLKDKVPGHFTGMDYELINTLVEIGYNQSEVMEVARQLDQQANLESKIQEAIALLARAKM